jgi:hypothetical protein
MSFFVKLFQIVNILSSKYNIDESHGIIHSMQILHYAHDIYENEKFNFPILQSEQQKDIIYTAAILHDMCDKKYVDENIGIIEIQNKWNNLFLEEKDYENTLEIATKIMSTMSYSKVKKSGFPTDLGDYEIAYHIVREADLLCAYDFDRSMIYHIRKNNCNILDAYHNAHSIFSDRILRHNIDNLFITEYGKKKSLQLHLLSVQQLMTWKKLLRV